MRNLLDGPGITGTINVSTTVEAKVGASAYSERTLIIIQPIDGDLEWSFNSGFGAGEGHILIEEITLQLRASDQLPVYIRAVSGTVEVRISEVG